MPTGGGGCLDASGVEYDSARFSGISIPEICYGACSAMEQEGLRGVRHTTMFNGFCHCLYEDGATPEWNAFIAFVNADPNLENAELRGSEAGAGSMTGVDGGINQNENYGCYKIEDSEYVPVVPPTPASLAEKWNITDPTFTYGGLSFDLTFTVSDFIGSASMAEATLYDERCKESDNSIDNTITAGGGSGIKSVTTNTDAIEVTASGGSNMNRDVSVNITVDSATISDNSLLYSEDTTGLQVTAEIRFCLRFGLKTTGPTPLEVNFLETLVTLTVDLTDGFEIGSIAVEPKDRLVRTANQVYQVVGFRCDAANVLLSDLTPINQGTVVRVCVTPDAEATADGIKMRSIDTFTWSRALPAPGVTQAAIISRDTVAGNQLTSYNVCKGLGICSFETILFANFYTALGAVTGSGVASMQFGSDANRRLRSGAAGRNLQDEVAAASEFDLDFAIAKADNVQGTSGASSMTLMTMGFLAVAAVAGLF